MRFLILVIAILLAAMAAVSCSHGSSPVIPGDNPIVSGTIEDSGLAVNPYRGVFGAWQVMIDANNLTAEILPSRNAYAMMISPIRFIKCYGY